MLRNYIKGASGAKINTLLTDGAFKMMKWMRFKEEEILRLIFSLFYQTLILVPLNIQRLLSIEKHEFLRITYLENLNYK